MRNKKATILAMLLAMVMTFAACGGDDADKVSGRITPAGSEQGADDKKDAKPTEAAGDEKQDADEDKDAAGKQDTEDEAGKNTSLGRIQGGVYVNEYMGVTCNLDSSWEFYTAEELQEIPENVEAVFEGTAMEDEMSNLTSITDMSAENATDLTSMNILYQKLSLQDRLAFKNMTNDDIVKNMLTAQKDVLIQMYAQAGINVHEIYEKTVTFCGEERLAIYMECDVSGVAYYGLQVVDYSLGEYAVTLTVTSFVDDKTDELLALFEKYE